MKIRNAFFMLMVVLNAGFVLSGLTGDLKIIYFSNESNCNHPIPTWYNFTAGDYVYVYMNFTLDPTCEDLVNAKTFAVDSVVERGYSQGIHSHPAQSFNINAGETLPFCYKFKTYETYRPGEWSSRMYFSTWNNYYITHTTKRFNVSSSGVPYEYLGYITNATGTVTVNPGEQRVFYVNYTNDNPTDPFIGTIRLQDGIFLSSGTASKTVTILPGDTINETFVNKAYNYAYKANLGIHADGSLGQSLIRSWRTFQVNGPLYQYRVHQVYASEPVYAQGSDVQISAQVTNAGNTIWNNACCRYRIRVKESISNTFIYDQYLPVTVDHPAGQTKWYTTQFTNTNFNPLTEFQIWIYMYNGTNQMQNDWTAPTQVYSSSLYPEVACTYEELQTDEGLDEQQTCPAGGNQVIFVRKYPEVLTSFTTTTGSLDMWWGGTKNGNEGYFIKGSPDAVYELKYNVWRIMDMDSFHLSYLLILFAAGIFVFFSLKKA